jgi:hypothetical protein
MRGSDAAGSDFDEAGEMFPGGGKHAYAANTPARGRRWRAAWPVDEQVVATGGVCAFGGDDRRDLVVGEEVVADSPRPVADGKVIELKQYRAEAEPASRT